MDLQQELIGGDPCTSAYQRTIVAFKQTGQALINSGFEDDLDRLLRLHVLPGGRHTRSSPSERTHCSKLAVLERRRR
jgi:hypothetical protein